MASGVFYSFKSNVLQGKMNLASDTIKVALMNSSLPSAVNLSTMTQWSNVSSYEITGTGYTSGGATATCGVSLSSNVADFTTTGTDGSGNVTHSTTPSSWPH